MKKILIYSCLVLLFSSTACKKWLDVKPDNQKTSEEQFTSYGGFADALNGAYIKLKSRDIYGENLTITHTESLAQLWTINGNSRVADFQLRNFDYDDENAAAAAMARVYLGLYNTIAHSNMIINHMPTDGSVITDTEKRAVIFAEALAIRAFCHFDVLRLFGSVPNNPTIQVSLPYAEGVSTTTLAKYYDYNQFVSKIEADLLKAEELLYQNDPIFKSTFAALNSVAGAGEDPFMKFRQNRFNYWAVKALQARFYLYIGNKQKAYAIAKSIIEAKNTDGSKLIALSGTADLAAKYYGLPSESLMMLNVHNIATYTPPLLATGLEQTQIQHLTLTLTRLNELFAGQSTSSNNRYLKVWTRDVKDWLGIPQGVLQKYYHPIGETASVPVNISKRQIVPLLRLSEMYLIVMETTTDLNEANSLWREYELSHEVLIQGNPFSSLDAVKLGVIDEYRRELFGEGQMFFLYKRLGATSMMWRTDPVIEENYVIPLPQSEFNPN